MALSKEQRVLRATLGAHARWAKHDPHEGTRAATEGFLRRFYVQVLEEAAERGEDLDLLTDAEIERRAKHLRKAYMLGLTFKASRAAAEKRAKAEAESSGGGAP